MQSGRILGDDEAEKVAEESPLKFITFIVTDAN